jgi:hypothetical protein
MQFVDKPFGSNVAILSPENAYMSGVLKSTNLDDLRRFERVFPLNPKTVMDTVLALRDEYAKRPEITPKDKMDVLFLTLVPKCFLPDQAYGWSAVLHFKINGAGEYTVAVSENEVSTVAGLKGTPTAVITAEYEDWRKLMRYELLEDSGLVETKQLDSWQDEESIDRELSDDMLEAVAGGKGGSCGAEASAGNACGADACGAAAGAGGACGAAACGAAAGVGTVCGAAACAADACAAAACGAAAGAGACGAAGCGANAGVGACAGDACGAAVGAGVCAGNVCGIDILGGADIGPCGINVIPLVPGC